MSTTWSSPDALEEDESIASSPQRNRLVNAPLRKIKPAHRRREISPVKQGFHSDENAISRKRIRSESDPHHQDNHETSYLAHYDRPSSGSSAARLSDTPYYSTPFKPTMKVRTTTVPLRGLSDSEAEAHAHIATPKRGRGRPRKSIATPLPSKAKRTSTPAAKMKVEPGTKTRRLSDLLGGSSGDNSEEWDFNIPQKNATINRGRSESHSRAAPASVELERASSDGDIPMSSRANRTGRRIGADGTPSAFGQSFRKAGRGQSRLGRLDFEAEQPQMSIMEYDRRSSESIVEVDVGFGPFDDSSRPGTGQSGRDMGSSPPGVGQGAYSGITPLRRDGRERQQSEAHQEFSFAQYEGEDYGQSSSINSEAAREPQHRIQSQSPRPSDTPKQYSDHELEQAQAQSSYTTTQQPSPLGSGSATPIPEDGRHREDEDTPIGDIEQDWALTQSRRELPISPPQTQPQQAPEDQVGDDDEFESPPPPPSRISSPAKRLENLHPPNVKEDVVDLSLAFYPPAPASIVDQLYGIAPTSRLRGGHLPEEESPGPPDEYPLNVEEAQELQGRRETPSQRQYDENFRSPTPENPLQQDNSPQQQYYDQESNSSSPAPSHHSHQSSQSNQSDNSHLFQQVPFPSLSPPPNASTSLLPNPQNEQHGEDAAYDEFDTVMENEDFTMITAETFPSLLQYFTSPLDPVEQAEIRAEIAAEEVALENEARREEDEAAQRRMRESGFMDIVHAAVERSVSRETDSHEIPAADTKDSELGEEQEWSLTQPRREIPRSPPIQVSGRGYVPSPTPPQSSSQDASVDREPSQQPVRAKRQLGSAESSEWEEPPPIETVVGIKSPPIRASGRWVVPSPSPPVQEEPAKEWDKMVDQRSESGDEEVEGLGDEREQTVGSDATELNTTLEDVAQTTPQQEVVEEQDKQSDGEDQEISQNSNVTAQSSQPADEPEIEDVVDTEVQVEHHEAVQRLRGAALLTPDETPSHSNMGAEEEVEVEDEEENVDIWALEAETYNQSRMTNHEDDSSATIRPQTSDPASRVVDHEELVQEPVAAAAGTVLEVPQKDADEDVWMAEASTMDVDPQPEPVLRPEPVAEPVAIPEPKPEKQSEAHADAQPEPPTPGFKRSLQRSQVEIELEAVLQKAQKRRSGLPDDWMRQSRGSFGNSLNSLHGGEVKDGNKGLDQTHHRSMLGQSMDGGSEERPSMMGSILGDASMIRRETRQREAELRREEQEKEAERIKNLAASKEAERQRRREERDLERRKRAEELEAELQREREEREKKREAERQKRREERERVRDEEINREREAKYLQKQKEEKMQKEKEEAQRKADEERKAQEEAQRKSDEQKREAEAQRQAELEAEAEAERLMLEAKRAAERDAERVAELRKEREAAKQRRREERQAEREKEDREIAENVAQRYEERRRERDKENMKLEDERAVKRRMLVPTSVGVGNSEDQELDFAPKPRERFPFSSIPTSARRLDTKVYVGGQEMQSTSYMLSPMRMAQPDDENNPFRISGHGKRTFEPTEDEENNSFSKSKRISEPRQALVAKPQSAAALSNEDFEFNPPTTRYTEEVSVVDDFEFRLPKQPDMNAFTASNNSRVRGARLGSFSDAITRPSSQSMTQDKEPEMEEVKRPKQREPLGRMMQSVEIAPPYSDGLLDQDENKNAQEDYADEESEDDAFGEAEKSLSVSVERSQSHSVSRSVSRSASVESKESGARSPSRSGSASVAPTPDDFDLTGALYAGQRDFQSVSAESSSQASSEDDEEEQDDVDIEVDAVMEDAPSQSASTSPSVKSSHQSSEFQSDDEQAEAIPMIEIMQDGDLDQEMEEEDEDEYPFSRFSDSENEIVASTPMPPRGLVSKPIPKRSFQPHPQPKAPSPERPHQRRGPVEDQSESDSASNHSPSEDEAIGGEDMMEKRQDRRSSSVNAGYRTSGVMPKSPLKSSFRHPLPPGSPKKAVIFSATTAVSPESSFEDRSDDTVTPAAGEQDLLDQLAEKGVERKQSRSPPASPTPSTSPTPSLQDSEIEVEAEEENVEDRSHLRPMTAYDWSKTHWKSLLHTKNTYEASPYGHEIPDWVRESQFVDETIWGGEEDGSMDLMVEAWMVDVARLFIERQEREAEEDWEGEMEHVLKRVYGLVSVERKCARQGKKAPWDVVARAFQPIKKRTVERLNSRGEWVEMKERKGFFGLGMGWL